MLSCCCDDSPHLALEKAFKVLQDTDQRCNKQQIYQMFHHFLHLVKSTHRINDSQELDDPYPLNRLAKIWESLQFEEFIDFEQFNQLITELEWDNCPLYTLEDLTLGSSSRPSSGKTNH